MLDSWTAEISAERRGADDLQSELLVRVMVRLTPADAVRVRVREVLIRAHRPLAVYMTDLLHGSDPDDDVMQAARDALNDAVERYGDDVCGPDFVSAVLPAIAAEVKLHLQDAPWSLRDPRGWPGMAADLESAMRDLTATSGRAPRPSELARCLGLSDAQLCRGLQRYWSPRRDLGALARGDGPLEARDELFDVKGAVLGLHPELTPAWRTLTERERRAVTQRFFQRQPPSAIATATGTSLKQVARLLTRSLEKLRRVVTPGKPRGPAGP